MNTTEFLAAIDLPTITNHERALALLWWAGRDDPARGLSAAQVCDALEAAGHARQNASRLNKRLADDRRTVKSGDGWRLHPRARAHLDADYSHLRQDRRQLRTADSVLPRELFDNTRGYIERVVDQVNASYELGLHDCCAVMCRRLLETLLIETYEATARAAEIKGGDGHFLMFGGLLAIFEKDTAFHPSRNALKGLRDFKTLGDLAAHNRRFNARKDDIDRVRDGLRIAAEELLHMSGLAAESAA